MALRDDGADGLGEEPPRNHRVISVEVDHLIVSFR
jgi:hypothetical protein